MVATSLILCTVYQRLARGGVDFPSNTTILTTREIEYFSFLGALTNLHFFGTPAVELLVYSDLNKERGTVKENYPPRRHDNALVFRSALSGVQPN